MFDTARNEKLQSLIGNMETLPSVPALYMELLDEMRKPQTTFKSVGAIISRDVGMTAKILQIVNSAFFGFYRNISSAEQAVGILGLRMIRSLVLSVNVFSQFDAAKLSLFPIEPLMQHSISTGALGRVIIKSQTKDTALMEDTFTAGMLHDAGKLVLADRATELYVKAHELAKANSIPLCDAEQEVLGITHAEVGAYLMKQWGLADNIVEAIAFHHRPLECPTRGFIALTVVHVANVLEHGARKGGEATRGVDTEYLAAIGMADRLDKWTEITHVLTRGER